MKSKELKEYRTKPLVELKKENAEIREKLNSLKLNVAMGKVKDLKELKQARTFINIIQ